MADKAKYVCVIGCGLKGKRIKAGDTVPANSDNTKQIRQLAAMGRIVDVNTKEGAAAVEAIAPKKSASLPGAK